MPDTSPFNLGHEIGQIQSKLDALAESTSCLPALSVQVAKHETELALIRRVGYFLGVGIVGGITTWFKTHFSPTR